jgi:anti-sigma regulatory factor (Ser/Thr protein kinase)
LRELALHILDIAENGITAGADCLDIRVDEARLKNRLEIVIQDNGRGIQSEKLGTITDPFYTTRTTRRVGLGLSLLKAAAQRCDGRFRIDSEPGKGTRVTATFRYDHIDRAPLGDMATTIALLIAGNSDVDFIYKHVVDNEDFNLDTRELRQELADISLTDPAVIHHLIQTIRDALDQLEQDDRKSESREKNNGKADN